MIPSSERTNTAYHAPPHGQLVVADAEPLAQLLRAARGSSASSLSAIPHSHATITLVYAVQATAARPVLSWNSSGPTWISERSAVLKCAIDAQKRVMRASFPHHSRKTPGHGGLEVLSDVPEDRRVDVPLVTAEVGVHGSNG
jgi:hypothetical protein